TATRQVVLDPVPVALVADGAFLEPQRFAVEPARACHVGHRVHRERHLLEHDRLLHRASGSSGSLNARTSKSSHPCSLARISAKTANPRSTGSSAPSSAVRTTRTPASTA